MPVKYYLGRLALFGAAALLSLPALADATLNKVKERGALIVGVTVNGSHFGRVDPATRKYQGFNVDLAAQIAKELGVALEVVEVQPSTRVQFLQTGKVDILIANMELTKERSEILNHVPTSYYWVGGTALFRKDSGISKWEDLRGKPVCLSQGSNYARPLATEYGAIPKGFKGSSESLLALRGNNCVAAVHDGILINPLLRDNAEWKDYSALPNELIPSPSVIWARKGEDDTVKAIDQIVQGWHRRGWLIETEKSNNILPPSPALVELHEKFKNGS
ncbi:transporter substrate-binding domain-containing protein [Pollutimonas bauzanensis]|nr:transporter substrate-binding domain-containing protein [Pollutimonas bauzanensis]